MLVTTDVMGLKREYSVSIDVEPKQPGDEAQEAKASDRSLTKTPYALFRDASRLWTKKAAALVQDEKGKSIAIHHLHDGKTQQDVVDLLDHDLVQQMLDLGLTIYEREPTWMNSLSNERVSLRDQLIDQTIQNMSSASELDSIDDIIKLYDSKDFKGAPIPDIVFHYKLKRAGVVYEHIGPLTVRHVQLHAFIRLHDLDTFRVMSQGEVQIELADCIIQSTGSPDDQHVPWDSYPASFMRSDDVMQLDITSDTPENNPPEAEGADQ